MFSHFRSMVHALFILVVMILIQASPLFLLLLVIIILYALARLHFFCIVLPLLVFLVLIILSMFGKSAKEQDAHIAEAGYRRLLEELKQNPTDADLRRRTIEAGRGYSQLTRDDFWGMLDYNERDLMRDISAATAGAAQGAHQTPLPGDEPPHRSGASEL